MLTLATCDPRGVANIEVANIPDDLHERLRRYASARSCTISTAVLTAAQRELSRWEWRERLMQSPTTDLAVEAAAVLGEERSLRGREIGQLKTPSPARSC